MNERIREIESRAWEQTNRTNGLVRTEDFNQKFAELIVRECLKIVEPDVGMACGDEWYTTLEGAAQEIKEHFGVDN